MYRRLPMLFPHRPWIPVQLVVERKTRTEHPVPFIGVAKKMCAHERRKCKIMDLYCNNAIDTDDGKFGCCWLRFFCSSYIFQREMFSRKKVATSKLNVPLKIAWNILCERASGQKAAWTCFAGFLKFCVIFVSRSPFKNNHNSCMVERNQAAAAANAAAF